MLRLPEGIASESHFKYHGEALENLSTSTENTSLMTS